MTPEQIHKALNDAADKIDDVHELLNPILIAWLTAKNAAAAATPSGTRKDVAAIGGLSEAAENGFYAFHDNSARLQTFLRELAMEF